MSLPFKLTTVPLRQVDENLSRFISEAKSLHVFGSDHAFEENRWCVTQYLPARGKNSETFIEFWSFGQKRGGTNIDRTPMAQPFLDFAKAYILWIFSRRKKVSLSRDVIALRVVGAALAKHSVTSPVMLTPAILNDAASILKDVFSGGVSYALGLVIQRLAHFIDERGMSRAPLQWLSPIAAAGSRARVGADTESRRARMLPSAKELEALGRAYRLSKHPEDIIFTSMVALMLSSPERSSEVATMLVDCESSTSGDGTPGYALRWWPAKGGAPQLKAVPSVMQDLVRDAISRIRSVTGTAREIARWYEAQTERGDGQPLKLFIPTHLEWIREKEFVTKEEISLLMWGIEGVPMDGWCRKQNLEAFCFGKTKRRLHRFSDVQTALLKELPPNFPYSDSTRKWKCSELLFTMAKYGLANRRASSYMFVPMDRADLNRRLDGATHSSIFANLGLNEIENGKTVPFQVSPHQFRHYLNHLAHSTGEMSQLDIDLWSGRTNRGEDYNHLTSEEISRKAQRMLSGSLTGLPTPLVKSKLEVIVRSEYARLGINQGHTTDFGYCVHDFAALPCQKHEDCLDCTEQFCIKGDAEKERNLRKERKELERLTLLAQQAVDEGIWKADRWLDRQRVNLMRVNAILAIIDNPVIAVGTPIRLTGVKSYTAIEHAKSIAEQENTLLGRQPAPLPRAELPQPQLSDFCISLLPASVPEVR